MVAHGCQTNSFRLRTPQRRARPLQERRIVAGGAFEPKDAGSEETVAPGRCDVVVILQRGRAEFVVVRVGPLGEDEPARGGHQRCELVAARLQ